MHQRPDEVQCDEIEHDRRDYLEHPAPAAQHLRDRCPEESRDRPRKKDSGEEQGSRSSCKEEAKCRRRRGAGEELSFSADVPDTRSERERDSQPGEKQRRRAHQRRGEERSRAAEGAAPKRRKRTPRIVACEMQDAGEQGDRDGEYGEGERNPRPTRAVGSQHAASLCRHRRHRTPEVTRSRTESCADAVRGQVSLEFVDQP